MTDADSSLCKLSLQLVIVMFSWSTTIALTVLELVGEDCFGHACVFHSRDVASPAQLHLKQDGLYAGQAALVLLRTSSFDSWSCHLKLRMERRQRW